MATAALLLAGPPGVRGDDPPPHIHDFSTNPLISSEPAMVCPDAALPGEVVTVGIYQTDDQDTCETGYGCCFQNGLASTPLKVTAWSDGNAGGAFGKLVGGQFTPTPDNPEQVTSYRCPTTLGAVSITATLDEETLDAVIPPPPPPLPPPDPPTVRTADDDPVTTDPHILVVWDITTPEEAPIRKYAMPDAQPSERQVIVTASRAAYWSVELGNQLSATWDTSTEPTTARTFTISTRDAFPPPPAGDPNYGKLPSQNSSFGPQILAAYEESCISFRLREFRLFFVKNASNHPVEDGHIQDHDFGLNLGQPPSPNWYHYWSQTVASSGNHMYDSILVGRNGPGDIAGVYVMDGSNIFWISTGACADNVRAYNSPKSPLLSGIDNFARFCLHEQAHADHCRGNLGGPWTDEGDADNDWLLDANETGQANALRDRNGQLFPTQVGIVDFDRDGANDCEEIAMDKEWAWVAPANAQRRQQAHAEDWSTGGVQWPNYPNQ
ncbi:MAG: hypothetical protein HY321_13595 [Armatimonadetes bacterium]|nr:hypothetical protein [Armatimonadota bacterium]